MRTIPSPRVIDSQSLAELIRTNPSVRLLDVRTPGEYLTGHIKGAYNVPLDQLSEHAGEIRAIDAPVVLICRSGQRARAAEATLQSAGMDNLHVLEGGMQAWEAADLPVRRVMKRVSLERQVRIVAGGVAATGALLALLVTSVFAWIPLLIGTGLVFSGVTDTCSMARLLAKLSYNRPAHCDVKAMVRALSTGAHPSDR